MSQESPSGSDTDPDPEPRLWDDPEARIETGTDVDADADIAPSIWSDPKVEIDKYNVPTGSHYVECEHCDVEVLVSMTDCATHRDGCPEAGTGTEAPAPAPEQ